MEATTTMFIACSYLVMPMLGLMWLARKRENDRRERQLVRAIVVLTAQSRRRR